MRRFWVGAVPCFKKYLGAAIGVVDAAWSPWPVNGYVASLLVQLDYATVGKNLISLVDAHSFWVDGYFEESNLTAIHQADPATIKLMGYPQTLRGHVNSATSCRPLAGGNGIDNGAHNHNEDLASAQTRPLQARGRE